MSADGAEVRPLAAPVSRRPSPGSRSRRRSGTEIRFPTLILPAGQYATRLSYSVAALARVGASPPGSSGREGPQGEDGGHPDCCPASHHGLRLSSVTDGALRACSAACRRLPDLHGIHQRGAIVLKAPIEAFGVVRLKHV